MAAGRPLAAVRQPRPAARARAALLAAAAGAAAFGGYDDLAGSGDRRGFRGHLGALAHGELTTGAVKLGGIGATGLARQRRCSAAARRTCCSTPASSPAAPTCSTCSTCGPAGPSRSAAGQRRAARRCGPGAAPLAARRRLGAALALLREDLGERAMLGDAGANALGAMLGAAAAASLPRPARIALLAGDHRPDRGQRGGQLHQGDRADPAAALAGHARPPRRSRHAHRRAPAPRPRPRCQAPRPGWASRADREPPGAGPPASRRHHAVTGPPAPVTEPGPLRQAGRGIGQAAVLIGGITVLARHRRVRPPARVRAHRRQPTAWAPRTRPPTRCRTSSTTSSSAAR